VIRFVYEHTNPARHRQPSCDDVPATELVLAGHPCLDTGFAQKLPAVHAGQSLVRLSVDASYVPTEHVWQSLALVAPAFARNVPAAQLVGADTLVCSQYLPAGQAAHALWPVDAW
jgi:hypothetical protein